MFGKMYGTSSMYVCNQFARSYSSKTEEALKTVLETSRIAAQMLQVEPISGEFRIANLNIRDGERGALSTQYKASTEDCLSPEAIKTKCKLHEDLPRHYW